MSDVVARPELEPGDQPADAGSQALSEALRSSFGIIKALMGVLFLVFLCSGIFKVGPDERAIKLRMGRVVGQGQDQLLRPGLHWSFPYPIEEYLKVSVSGVKRVTSTVGWYATTPEQEIAQTEPMPGPTLNPAVDGYVLTADDNIIHARASLSYHVAADPTPFVFHFRNVTNAIQHALDNSLLYAAAHFKVDEVLRLNVLGFREAVLKRVNELVDTQGMGIIIDECAVESRPPRQLRDAFDSVLNAELGRNKALNEALSFANQVTNKAGADANSRIISAKSDRVRYVNDMAAQAGRFQDILPNFQQNPKLFVEKSLTEAVGRVFTNAQDKIFVSDLGKSREFRPSFNLPLPKAKAEEQK